MSTTTPVSGLQRGLWFMDRWNPGSPAYLVPWVFEFDGPVDARVLHRALRLLVGRHEALRTTFDLGADGPVRTVHSGVRLPFASVAVDGPAALRVLLDNEARVGFDLTEGPLLRATLVTGPGVADTLVLVVHHIVWDGWSAGVFERELAEVYTALAADREPDLAPLTPAADSSVSTEDSLAYWTGQLAGAPAELTLPTDRPRPPSRTFAGGTEMFGLPAGTAARVQDLAADLGATPFVVQVAAFAALLHRYTGARDLVVGTPVTTRDRPELAGVVGYFVNIVALRVRIDPAATFADLVEQVRDTAFDSYAYLDAPFDEIVDALALERTARHAPLVQVVFGAHAEDPAPLRFGTATASRRMHHNDTSKFDLTWSTFDDGELRGEVEYATDLFDRETVLRMAGHWRTLLAAALDAPDKPLWRLSPLDAAETAVALAPPRATQAAVPPLAPPCAAPDTSPPLARPRADMATPPPLTPPPADMATPPPLTPPPADMATPPPLHRAFEAAVDAHPDRLALTHGDRSWTYAELDAAANRVAHTLAADGVRRGDRVGVLLERGERVVTTILGVLKAGAAYVPVDLATPADRAGFVFADTGVEVVVTDDYLAGPRLAEAPSHRPETHVGPADLAYVIFTSGSTGKPKGVAVSHEHVGRLMRSGLEHFAFAETDVWTLFHSYAFDWTVWELWGPLLHGGRLVVVPRVVSRSPEAFADLLATESVTRLCLTPSALRTLEGVLRAWPLPLPALRSVMLGGEALDPAVVRRWFALEHCPPAVLCNLYGITETTVHVTTLDLPDADRFGRSLIGEPMPHLSALVLDERLRPCPIGVAGELYIGGGSLANGYWGRASLTARRFLPDPYGVVPGGRLYRTGDVARRLPGGGLEYVGRCDDQVKIRGFRIELGEVEAAVTAHPAVTSCVVTVHDDRLAAYVTVDGTPPSYAELRAFLAETLPEHMIPATATVLAVIPLTVNGKVDRAALPAPDFDSVRDTGTHVAPSTPQEHALAEVYADVLGVDGVGARDNFFHLGGDSIRAVHLAGRLRERGWTLELPDLFGAPTPAELGPLLKSCTGPEKRSAPFDLVSEADRKALPADVVDAYPMVAMQMSMIFHMELSDDAGGYHNVNSYRVAGTLDETALRRAVGDAMTRHPVLRTTLDVSRYSEPLQLVHAEAPIPVHVADLRGLSPEAQDAAVADVFDDNVAARFDLRTAPLFRVTAQHLSDDAFQLTVAEHHAILDGWSFTSLLTEVLERHSALSADPGRAPLPAPRSTFRDFVAVEQEALASQDSERYWKSTLDGASGTIWSSGPPELDEPEIPRTIEHVVPGADAMLRDTARRHGVTVKTVGLAAHVAALHRITGLPRFTTGLSVNGRLETDGGTEAYGLFLNTVPLVVDFTENGADLIKAMHEAEAAMLPHRRMPFARIARHLADTRLEACFAFLRFHSLGRLADSPTRLLDDRIGCEPTLRYEPTSFALGAALVQDPSSARVLLAVDHLPSVVPDDIADAYADAYVEALRVLAADSTVDLRVPEFAR
ncbi:amino acid adenylation domain-containing protein [Lentzea albidocapillata subsp. violacea]|uniref:Amino acid adenylation domain-containing protein n=1 Tax=Lentzea albidocapillata subsp. violacea TaxID=128104 RepID=A0A1G8SFH4_9PSEU|nr:non-ribosomal peptide synthetase [Lentzea albidocapillata]SDJ27948.1 amino acid adenylation domain-containing protein [Lentzea albidocapillata subsp. violacea]